MRVRTRSACVALAWGILLLLTAAGPLGSPRPAQATTSTTTTTTSTGSTRTTGSANTTTTTTTTTQAALASSVTSDPAARPAAAAAETATRAAAATQPAAARAQTATQPAAARAQTATRAAAATQPAAGTRAAAGTYVVQPGDTLSGIAAALGVPGGWPALYAANRPAIGPDPGLIRPGTALTLPGTTAAARYTVAAGDTLSGIAAALAVPGGWPALYAANRPAIGPDPSLIRPGTMLAIPRPPTTTPAPPTAPPAPTAPRTAPAPASTPTTTPASGQATEPAQVPASAPARPPARAAAPAQAQASASASASAPAAARAPASAPAVGRPRPRSLPTLPTGGLPRWLEIVLIAAGLLIATAFLTEPTLAIARRRRAARPGAASGHIVLADYDRLVVTHCGTDGTVYVLRPPGADPQAILLAARLVLAQDRYEELAGQLGVPANWPRE